MMSAEDGTPVARIAKPFGRAGELLVNLYDTFPAEFDREEPLFVRVDGLTVPLFCDRFQRRGRNGALVVFSDFGSERRAAGLVGRELLLCAASVPGEKANEETDPGVIYLEDLVGLKAVIQGGAEGVIEEFIDGENPLFLLSVGGREVYVPAVDEFILETDLENGRIRFELPEGLIELNG